MQTYECWGRYPKARQNIAPVLWAVDSMDFRDLPGTVLPFGRGRSYGDVCLNDGGTLLDTSALNHLMEFDEGTGLLRCEAGVTFAEILLIFVPRGWFLPVTPGTKFVTVGGAIANDVHGKNHHRAGTFGNHVRCFELARSDGSRLLCSSDQNQDMFRATIGGLGLTGLIVWAEIQLRAIESPLIDVETIKFRNLDEFLELATHSDASHEYTVAWADSTTTGADLGRGVFMRGNHAKQVTEHSSLSWRPKKIGVPMNLPGFILNKCSVGLFNNWYYGRAKDLKSSTTTHYDPFFYPLDSILNWNRVYGKKGFMQYQCVIPVEDRDTMVWLYEEIANSGFASFLTVVKVFGSIPSVGMMSFARKGITFALDFPNKGAQVFSLLDRLDAKVRACGGAVNPSKDARMSAESFRSFFPQWKEFSRFIDPKFSSSFWRRVTS